MARPPNQIAARSPRWPGPTSLRTVATSPHATPATPCVAVHRPAIMIAATRTALARRDRTLRGAKDADVTGDGWESCEGVVVRTSRRRRTAPVQPGDLSET